MVALTQRVSGRCTVRTMKTLEIITQLISASVFERFAGMRFAYKTTISDGTTEVVGRGPTPEQSHEAAQELWESANFSACAAMLP